MIVNPFKFSTDLQRHIDTFDGDPAHWNGVGPIKANLRRALKRHYLVEKKYHCIYCDRLRQDYHGAAWDIDHIIPKSSHPKFTYEPKNLAISCKDCNTKKGTKNVLVDENDSCEVYPNKSISFLIIHPHFDEFSEHIEVKFTDKKEIIHNPLTQKGLETFRICGLSRFSEIIAGTSESIPESELTIGFLDDDFAKMFQEVKDVISRYSHNPLLMAYLCEKLLVDAPVDKKINVNPSISRRRLTLPKGKSRLVALPPPKPKED